MTLKVSSVTARKETCAEAAAPTAATMAAARNPRAARDECGTGRDICGSCNDRTGMGPPDHHPGSGAWGQGGRVERTRCARRLTGRGNAWVACRSVDRPTFRERGARSLGDVDVFPRSDPSPPEHTARRRRAEAPSGENSGVERDSRTPDGGRLRVLQYMA